MKDRSQIDNELRAIAKRLEGRVPCGCDFDKWEPERSTGHTLECRIHMLAIGAWARRPSPVVS